MTISKRFYYVPLTVLIPLIALSLLQLLPVFIIDTNAKYSKGVLLSTKSKAGVSDLITVTAVVVKSWGTCPPSSLLIWDELNSNWSSYGSTPIVVNYNHPQLCTGPITYTDLVASDADVLIISNPTGGEEQYSVDEIAAILTYAEEGHNIIGTYQLFQNPTSAKDNRGLAPLFGLHETTIYTATSLISTTFTLIEPANPLFTGMMNQFISDGFTNSQVPEDNSWDAPDLNGARIVAKTADNAGAIFVYDGLRYHAIYVTHMPEFSGNIEDERFFYNAITYPRFTESVFLPIVLR